MSDYPRPIRVQYKDGLEELGIAIAPDVVEVAVMGLLILKLHDVIRIDGELREVTGLRKSFVMDRPGMEGADAACRITHRSLRDASLQDLEVLLDPWEPGPNKPRTKFTKLPYARLGAMRGAGYLQITDPGLGARGVEGTVEPADEADRRKLAALQDTTRRAEFVGKVQKCDGPVRPARMDVYRRSPRRELSRFGASEIFGRSTDPGKSDS